MRAMLFFLETTGDRRRRLLFIPPTTIDPKKSTNYWLVTSRMEALTNNTSYILSFNVLRGRLDLICTDAVVGKN